MKCPECGAEINDNDVFCGSCGAEIIYNNIDTENAEQKHDEKSDNKKTGSKNKKDSGKKEKKRSFKTTLKIAGVIAAVIVIAIIIVCVLDSVRSSKGRKIFEQVPLGRDIDIIEADTGAAFISGENSSYGALNHIADYDYICEAEDSVTVSGIKLPEWAVLLRKGSDNSVNEAVLYNFGAIKHNWMGSKTAAKIETAAIEYGVSAKSAERTLGLKPYTIIKESAENMSIYVYRYHYVDDESGNTVVMNFYVAVSDVDNQVKNVYDKQLDYLNLILQTENN